MLIHSDDGLRRADRDARWDLRTEELANRILAPDENEVRWATFFPIQQSAPDYLVRGVVAAHRVDGDFHWSAAVLTASDRRSAQQDGRPSRGDGRPPTRASAWP